MAMYQKTKDKVLDKVRSLAREYGVGLALNDADTIAVIGRNAGASSGMCHDGVIMLGDPEKDYDTLEWFVLCFLHELSHCILNEIVNKQDGHYSDMMKHECIWRAEFWCWNNAMDLGRSIFGICLSRRDAVRIIDNLSSYATRNLDCPDSKQPNFYYAENDNESK